MKVLIIGAGAAGSIAAKFLAESPDVQQIVLGDIDLHKAKQFIVPGPKITFQTINATDTAAVTDAAKGMALLINASLPSFNLSLMKIALAAGAHYQDFASDWENGHVEQLQLDAEFKKARLKGLINASAAPGVTNLMAGALAEGLKRIEYVKVRLLEDVSSDVPFTAWSKAILFDEIWNKPITWEFGKFVTKNNFADEEFSDFPAPHEDTKCYLLAQEEIGTIPKYIKTNYADLKAGGGEIELARTLFKLGLFKKTPMKIGETTVVPYDFLLKIWPDVPSPRNMIKLAESGKLHNANFWASVEERGIREKKSVVRKAMILFPDQIAINKIYPGANYVSYAAGLSAAIFALSISKIKQTGVFPPEAIESGARNEIIEALRKRDIKIDITEKEQPGKRSPSVPSGHAPVSLT